MAHTVLLIDDSIPFHKLVKAYLEPDRTAIHSVYDGEAGLAAAEKFRPSLILLDVDIPCIDGFEVCRRLKANPVTQSIPLIFLTADSMSGRHGQRPGTGGVGLHFQAIQAAAISRSDQRDAPRLRQPRRRHAGGRIDRPLESAYFDQHINQYVSLAARWETELACIMIELDSYSALVANHGQEVAGGMVQTAGADLLGQSRTEDLRLPLWPVGICDPRDRRRPQGRRPPR